MVDKSEKFRWLVRLGYAARGVVYLVLGYLALTAAAQAEGGGTAVFDMLENVPLGTLVLWLMAIGLLSYAAFKAVSAVWDVQRRGTDAGGLAHRAGDGASALAHAILAYAAFQYASGSPDRASGGGQESQTAGSVLELPLGEVVVGLVGLGFLVGAFLQARHAVTAQFMASVSSRAPAAVEPIGRFGHAARALVFAVIGWSLLQSAWFDSEAQVKGLGEAIVSLRGEGTLFTLMALGLLAFGLYNFVLARFGVVPDVRSGMLR